MYSRSYNLLSHSSKLVSREHGVETKQFDHGIYKYHRHVLEFPVFLGQTVDFVVIHVWCGMAWHANLGKRAHTGPQGIMRWLLAILFISRTRRWLLLLIYHVLVTEASFRGSILQDSKSDRKAFLPCVFRSISRPMLEVLQSGLLLKLRFVLLVSA